MALEDILKPQLVELGSIKIGTLGEKRTSRGGAEFRLPKKLDHFEVMTKFRGENGLLIPDEETMSALKADYADEDGHLRKIPIAVLSDHIPDFLRASWAYYRGKQCIARSDGKTLTRFISPEGEKLDPPQETEWTEEHEHLTQKISGNDVPVFKKHISLDAVIAIPEARWGGIYRFRTTSAITGDQLYGSLIHLKQLTGGVLTGMPLMLVVRPVQVSPGGKTTTVYVVHVELRGNDLMHLQKMALERARFQKENRKQLLEVRREMKLLLHDPGEGESPDVQSDIQQEFHPEAEKPDTSDNFRRVFDAKLSSIGCESNEQRDAVIQWALEREVTYEQACDDKSIAKEVMSRFREWETAGNHIEEILKFAIPQS